METVSENTPKPKRGRPKSYAREFIEGVERAGLGPQTVSSTRGKVDCGYRMAFIGAVLKATVDLQSHILGCTAQDIKNGTARFPRGFDTACTEIGRWLAIHDESEEAKSRALEIVANACTDGIAWRHIRAHFRKLRLGERQGNAVSLFAHLARAFDDYCRRFPATTQAAKIAGARNLLDAIEASDE